MKLLRLLVAACATLLLAGSSAAQDRTPGYLNVDRLRAEIELSHAWLRAQQDEATGGYGGVDATCWVLKAFAESHAGYGYDDGPFISRAVDYLLSLQNPDGSIYDEGAREVLHKTQTGHCGETLKLFLDQPHVREARARCIQYHPANSQSSFAATYVNTTDRELLDIAESILLNRKREGYWPNPMDTVKGTALATTRLARIHGELVRRGQVKASAEAVAKAEQSLIRGANYLLTQAEDGRFGFPGTPDPGITAMVAGALLSAPRSEATQAVITRALDWLVELQQEDGSIHAGQYRNYVTSAAVMALARAGREQDAEVIARARAFLQELQIDEGEGFSASDPTYGGIGYGGDERPDLSNLQMALEALNAAGVEGSDPTMQKALAFLQRCQNRSESNDITLTVEGITVKSGEDGGSAYAPGESKAGMVTLADGTQVPRSYGSMTYALLKGYLFAGLKRDDPRVVAAWKWLQKNYTLDINPGFEASADASAAYQGLFYYFYTMARALDLFGVEVIEDAAGMKHAWRGELVGRVVAMQRQDGSWVNENAARWYEGNPVLATAYAMMAIRNAMPDAPTPR